MREINKEEDICFKFPIKGYGLLTFKAIESLGLQLDYSAELKVNNAFSEAQIFTNKVGSGMGTATSIVMSIDLMIKKLKKIQLMIKKDVKNYE